VTEELLAQHLESPSGTGRDDPENHQPTTGPRTTRGSRSWTGSTLTGQSKRVSGSEKIWFLSDGNRDYDLYPESAATNLRSPRRARPLCAAHSQTVA
jgi:hypothetical protein